MDRSKIVDLEEIDRQLSLLANEDFLDVKKKKKRSKKKLKERKDEEVKEERFDKINESQKILSRWHEQREKVKCDLLEERSAYLARIQNSKIQKQQAWKAKLDKSPFMINLIAEAERIEEENKMRLAEASVIQSKTTKQKNRVKNDIILKALQESSDLEALRAEKRLIMEEERRLKALIGMEKAKANKKQDLMAAMRAEKQRKQMKLEYRRQKRMEFEQHMKDQSKQALMEKLGLV